MNHQLTLSEDEKTAKNFILKIALEANQLCDVGFDNEKFKLPHFYDHAKFIRGQKYFKENHASIMFSEIYGLLSLAHDPSFAKIIDETKKSSTIEKAEKRFIDTFIHFELWYMEELKPGSKSWESLKKVRKLHLAASNASLMRKDVGIRQEQMVAGIFGFMAYPIIKPHLLNINHNCEHDREAFVHTSAVICSMLGIKDEYNICLHSLPVVELICHGLLRYHFIPLLQVETKTSEKLCRVVLEMAKKYIPISTYESTLFQTRRLAGVPGYQYKIDMSKEFYLKQIFTKNELESLRVGYQNIERFEFRQKFLFDEKICIVNIKRMEKGTENTKIEEPEYPQKHQNLRDFMELKYSSELEVVEVEDEKLTKYLNDDKFKLLSRSDQWIVEILIFLGNSNNSSFRMIFNVLSIALMWFFNWRTKAYKVKK